MSKVSIFFIFSLLVLGALLFTLFSPIATGGEFSEVQREGLLKTETGYFVQFDIINNEGENKKYIIEVAIDDYRWRESVLIPDGRIFTYVHQINPDRLTEGNVSFAIYKEGEELPFEQATYYLK